MEMLTPIQIEWTINWEKNSKKENEPGKFFTDLSYLFDSPIKVFDTYKTHINEIEQPVTESIQSPPFFHCESQSTWSISWVNTCTKINKQTKKQINSQKKNRQKNKYKTKNI